jgi:hypothetical protein
VEGGYSKIVITPGIGGLPNSQSGYKLDNMLNEYGPNTIAGVVSPDNITQRVLTAFGGGTGNCTAADTLNPPLYFTGGSGGGFDIASPLPSFTVGRGFRGGNGGGEAFAVPSANMFRSPPIRYNAAIIMQVLLHSAAGHTVSAAMTMCSQHCA